MDDHGHPVRYGEGVMRLWIAPYEDTDGNYHQANRVYSVVQEGQWMHNPNWLRNKESHYVIYTKKSTSHS